MCYATESVLMRNILRTRAPLVALRDLRLMQHTRQATDAGELERSTWAVCQSHRELYWADH